MIRHDIDKEVRLRMLIDLAKLKDAGVGSDFESAYMDRVTTDEEKDLFISIMGRSILHGISSSYDDVMKLATQTAEILVTRKMLNKILKSD